jgi:hypothetical protein
MAFVFEQKMRLLLTLIHRHPLTDVMSMFEQTSTSKLNADIKENMKARAKGVIKEGDTIIDGTKIISKEAKQAYSDFLRKRVFPLTASICPYALL